MAERGVLVPPTSRKSLRNEARKFREILELDKPRLPIVSVLEFVLPQIVPHFVFEVADSQTMGQKHGLTFPDEPRIVIREDVYEGARRGVGRDRLTHAHELAHFILHRDVSFARTCGANVPRYCDSEWQANCFAGELLVSAQHLDGCSGPSDLADRFGVSQAAAEIQWKAFKGDGLVK